MNKIRIILILFLILLILPQCSRSKKNFPWWLFLLNSSSNESDISSFNNLGGGSDGSSGGGFTPASGIIDPTFGSNPDNGSNNDANEPNGYMSSINFGTTIDKMDMAIQSDGKILLVGTAWRDKNGNNNWDGLDELDVVVVRFNPDGTIDTTFGDTGDNGVQIIDVSQLEFEQSKMDRGHSITIDNTGNIYLSATTQDNFSILRASVIKLDPSGKLVNTFDDNGIKIFKRTDNQHYPMKIKFYQDNLYIGGYFSNGSANYDVFLTKMDLNGNIDTSFGTSGYFIYNSDNKPDYSYSFVIDENGYIYISHVRKDDAHNIGNSILKINSSNGTLIASSELFWTTGFTARDIVMDNSGNIYLIGEKCRDDDSDGECDDPTYLYDFGLLKWKPNLNDPVLKTIQLSTSNSSYAYSGTIQPDGKILLGGYTIKNSSPFDDFALIRIDSNGNLDNSFGNNGVFEHNFYDSYDRCYTIQLLPSGKILMGGYTKNSNNSQNLTVIRIQ